MGLLQLLLFGAKKVASPRRRRPIKPLPRIAASDPHLTTIWQELRRSYFPDRPDIDAYRIVWSSRGQKRVLATCFPTKHTVKVARELRDPTYAEWLAPLLYHEMCHAYLGVLAPANGRRRWHGPEFRALEKRHPDSVKLDRWIKSGGWSKAVRSDRSKRAAAKRRGPR